MASVTSLDADVRNLRLSRYTPQVAQEARTWIESTLGEPLPPGDLLDTLKDGVALCKLANAATQAHSGAIKFKASAMPFMQMENISHFLRACELPPLSMPAHDRFLTVDLYEQKDPAQVLQCLSAFSRQAHNLNPSKFPNVIGPKKSATALSPNSSGYGSNASTGANFRRPASPVKPASAQAVIPTRTGGSTGSQTSANAMSNAPVSSWSSKTAENSTAPAWNIAQYGYMGGASQGNQGISFGARRQITSTPPAVPSLAQKEKMRKEKEIEFERQRQHDAEERERRERAVVEEAERERREEEKRWEEETNRMMEAERQRVELQAKEWADEERRWKEKDSIRQQEDTALQASMSKKVPPERPRVASSSILRGQTLAEYQREQAASATSDQPTTGSTIETPEQQRVRELEKQLEEARERERLYHAEREERLRKDAVPPATNVQQKDDSCKDTDDVDNSWVGDERESLRQQWQKNNTRTNGEAQASTNAYEAPQVVNNSSTSRPPPALPVKSTATMSPFGSRPLPTSKVDSTPSTNFPSRPLPEPTKQIEEPTSIPAQSNRTDNFLSSNPAPVTPTARVSSANEAGDTSIEQAQLRDSRIASQQKTKAGGWASKSLLEREMERERERQREWEASQQEIKDKPRDTTQGTGQGQTWDVNQYGYMAGDSQNKGSSVGSGINFGGRRQIIGPRPKPN